MANSFVKAAISAFIITVINFPLLTSNKSHKTELEESKEKTIPGTSLVPDKYYVVSMKRYPGGYLTWTTEKHKTGGYRYMLLMNSVNDPNYEKGGKWYTSTQWKFLATEEPGWYHLVNRYYPEEYATWSPQDRYLKNGYYIVLDSNYPGTHPTQGDFYFKPIQPKKVDRDQYQLKIKTLPTAVVTWSKTHHLENHLTYYIHADNSSVQYLEQHFSPEGDWFDDSIFIFVEPEEDDEDGKNSSINLKYERVWVKIICYALITKIVHFTV